MSKVPLEENHTLHGTVFGVGVSAVLKLSGRPLGESITVGGMAGTLATAYMKTFGHPDFLQQFKKKG
jgi:hypothetical protein